MIRFLSVVCLLCVIKFTVQRTDSPTGTVELDEISFEKVINKFDASLVKFDVAFPYGDKHEAFVALAKDVKDSEEILIAEVGVKDYGAKDNQALAEKYGANKDNFPVVKLFIKGKSDPVSFDDSKGFTSDDLRRFVRQNTGFYFSLPGCNKELDMLAIKFMKAKKDDRKNVLKEVEKVQKDLPDKDKSSGKIYKTIMEKILDKGDEFVKTENERVKKILSGKVSDDKKKELGIRINILQTFQLDNIQKSVKQEL